MLIAYLKRKHPDFCENPPNITDLTQLYKAAKLLFNEDEKFKHDSHVEVVKLQAGDAENTKIWKKLCDLSKQMFEVVYVFERCHDLRISIFLSQHISTGTSV